MEIYNYNDFLAQEIKLLWGNGEKYENILSFSDDSF